MGGEWGRVIGALLLGQFVLVVVLKIARGDGPEVFWMSHVGLLMAALGLLAQRRALVAAALTAILLLHAMWIIDAAGWLVTGRYPLNFAPYIHKLGYWAWIGTSHHVYLAPLLLWVVLRDGRYPASALPIAMGVYAVLTIFSRFFLPAKDNVNSAFGIHGGPEVWVVAWTNTLPTAPYLVMLNVLTTAQMFLPAAALLAAWSGCQRRFVARRGRAEKTSPAAD